MIFLKRTFSQLKAYPAAIGGVVVITGLVLISLYAIIAIPYNEAIRLWRGGAEIWSDSPQFARPIWYNWTTGQRLPRTIVVNSQDDDVEKTVRQVSEDTREITYTLPFEFDYSGYPQEINIFIESNYETKAPLVSYSWLTPAGEEIRLGDIQPARNDSYRLALDDRLLRRLDDVPPEQGLFDDPTTEVMDIQSGEYKLMVSALVFEDDTDVDSRLVVYGQVDGLAGTDHRRRDLMIPLLWGTPIAMTFGLLASLGTGVLTMIIAAIGVWFGGWVDALIQRLTEVNLVLPLLPVLVMIGTFYSRSIWVILGVVIVLSVFGAAIKTYRAIFLQVKESSYIEAARSYGATDARIIFRYLIPRIIPLLIPGLITSIPGFVFLEAALTVLGLGDPILPTWGKMIDDARSNGALFNGYYYWVLQPTALLMLVGLGFASLGFALDRIFNPRLRGL